MYFCRFLYVPNGRKCVTMKQKEKSKAKLLKNYIKMRSQDEAWNIVKEENGETVGELDDQQERTVEMDIDEDLQRIRLSILLDTKMDSDLF